MANLGESYAEQVVADLEDNNKSFYSDIDEDGTSPYFEEEDEGKLNPKEYRDIAEGKNLNNSYTGPYPESWDHLHFDKGANPQFMMFSEKKEMSVLDLAMQYGLLK